MVGGEELLRLGVTERAKAELTSVVALGLDVGQVRYRIGVLKPVPRVEPGGEGVDDDGFCISPLVFPHCVEAVALSENSIPLALVPHGILDDGGQLDLWVEEGS